MKINQLNFKGKLKREIEKGNLKGTIINGKGKLNHLKKITFGGKLNKKSQEFGIRFIDAPISGGQAGAENGVLSIMCGGNESDYKLAEPILEVYSKICRRIGDTGAGQKTKMCNQIAIAGLVQGLSEALHFAEKAGLDGSAVIEVISQGAAGSWQMESHVDKVFGRTFGLP